MGDGEGQPINVGSIQDSCPVIPALIGVAFGADSGSAVIVSENLSDPVGDGPLLLDGDVVRDEAADTDPRTGTGVVTTRSSVLISGAIDPVSTVNVW